ncbi:MAG: hypothetical protein HZC13_01495 [Nitrospirae bacterium]|nr:hypothetical protein [Nitrospirota bacterium]
MKSAPLACIAILVLSAVALAGNVKIKAEQEAGAEVQFKDWGISFITPGQWQRWSSAKESAVAAQAQQSVDAATLKEKVVHLAGWSTADDAAFMVLTIKRERSGRALQLSDLLARIKRDDKRAKEYGDTTQINLLEIGKVGGHECIVHDVTLRGGGRMLTYQFVSGPEQTEVQWLFRDAARFAQFKPAIDRVLQTLSLGGSPKKQ